MTTAPPDDGAVRDALALERTRLANERTFLAYIRTALALWAGSAAVFHFSGNLSWGPLLATCLLAFGAATIGTGFYRFFRTRARLSRHA